MDPKLSGDDSVVHTFKGSNLSVSLLCHWIQSRTGRLPADIEMLEKGDINDFWSLGPVMQVPRTAEKAVQMYKRTVTEAVCEQRLATAVSMPETSQRESHNAVDFCCLHFQRSPALGATTQFMDGAGVVKRGGDGVRCGRQRPRCGN
jgi:hypothetical protein